MLIQHVYTTPHTSGNNVQPPTKKVIYKVSYHPSGENMAIELSRMFGMDIYTTDAEYVGKAYDFIIDLEEGRIYKITLEPFRITSKQDLAEILKKKSLDYTKVVAVKDIILINKNKPVQQRQQPKPLLTFRR